MTAFGLANGRIVRQQLRRDVLLLLRGACRWPRGFWFDPVLAQQLPPPEGVKVEDAGKPFRWEDLSPEELEQARQTYIAGLIHKGEAEELMQLAREDYKAKRPILGVRDRRLQRKLEAIVRQGKPQSILRAFRALTRGGRKGRRPLVWKQQVVGEVMRLILEGTTSPEMAFREVARRYGISTQQVRRYCRSFEEGCTAWRLAVARPLAEWEEKKRLEQKRKERARRDRYNEWRRKRRRYAARIFTLETNRTRWFSERLALLPDSVQAIARRIMAGEKVSEEELQALRRYSHLFYDFI